MSPDNRALLNAIQAAVSPIPPSFSSKLQGTDLFEAYILTLVIRAAQREGASIIYETATGASSPSIFYYRTSPGHIYSTLHPYTHAVIEFAGKPALEAHSSVLVLGKSGVLHECDIAVLDRREAQDCRALQREPRSSRVCLSAEAKFYSTTLGIELAREFIGLISDLSSSSACFVANKTSTSVAKLLAARRDRHWYDNVKVKTTASERLFNHFATEFQRYRAR